jgi:hypothetical protein
LYVQWDNKSSQDGGQLVGGGVQRIAAEALPASQCSVMIQIEQPLVYRAGRFCYKLVTDAQHRGVALIRLKKPQNLFQPHGDTAPNRYPAVSLLPHGGGATFAS